jgi:endonuclease/exonuclease/phosphatase family metal-dependent hydrolase
MPSLRLVTYNIRGGLGMDEVRSTQRIAEVIEQTQADIICLQEVHQRLPWSRFQDQPGHLARLLRKAVVFQANFGYGIGGFGNAILTGLPILATHSFQIPNQRERSSILKMPEKRGLFRADLQPEKRGLTVFTTHWSLHANDRIETAAAVANHIRAVSGPVILCGDFNAVPNSPEMEALLQATGLVDAGSAASELTFTSDKPTHRIDYILMSPDIHVNSVEVVHTQASDHLPVVVDFDLP